MTNQRSRSRSIMSTYRDYTDGVLYGTSDYPSIFEYFNDPRVKPGPCYHLRVSPMAFTLFHINGRRVMQSTGLVPSLVWLESSVSQAVGPYLNRLDRNKLPTTNKAGILQILAEIDDTIAMFALRFWKKLSYGAVNWGIIPFVSDIKAVCQTVQNLAAKLDDFRYTDVDTFSIPAQAIPESDHSDFFLGNLEVKIRRNGSGDISDTPELNRLLDRLGLHPDLGTAWDLIPMSFLIDYIFPLGNYLESWRGWTTGMNFSGWRTFHVNGHIILDDFRPSIWFPSRTSTTFEIFHRVYENTQVLSLLHDRDLPSLKLPSIIQMINMLYVAMMSRKR